jgi:hypothetical protein
LYFVIIEQGRIKFARKYLLFQSRDTFGRIQSAPSIEIIYY